MQKAALFNIQKFKMTTSAQLWYRTVQGFSVQVKVKHLPRWRWAEIHESPGSPGSPFRGKKNQIWPFLNWLASKRFRIY